METHPFYVRAKMFQNLSSEIRNPRLARYLLNLNAEVSLLVSLRGASVASYFQNARLTSPNEAIGEVKRYELNKVAFNQMFGLKSIQRYDKTTDNVGGGAKLRLASWHNELIVSLL